MDSFWHLVEFEVWSSKIFLIVGYYQSRQYPKVILKVTWKYPKNISIRILSGYLNQMDSSVIFCSSSRNFSLECGELSSGLLFLNPSSNSHFPKAWITWSTANPSVFLFYAATFYANAFGKQGSLFTKCTLLSRRLHTKPAKHIISYAVCGVPC